MCDLCKCSQNLAFDFRRSSLLNLLVEVVLFSDFLSNFYLIIYKNSIFAGNFVRIFYKKNIFTVITSFKTVTSFLLPSSVSWSLLIQLTKLNKKFYTGVIVSLQRSKIPLTWPFLFISFITIIIESPFHSAFSIVTIVRLWQIQFVICNSLCETKRIFVLNKVN